MGNSSMMFSQTVTLLLFVFLHVILVQPSEGLITGGRSWLTDDELCYHGTCPPSKDVRIVDEDWYDRTTTADHYKCWQHCKFLRGEPGIGCLVWTYNNASNHLNCYTYNRYPDCYMTKKSKDFYSGGSWC